MVVYTLLKKHTFAVLKCQKIGPSEKSEMMQDQSWLQGAHVCWEVCVRWNNGSTTWEKLSDFKECYPVQTAEYAVTNYIDTKTAFNYWVPHTLKKRDSIIPLMHVCLL